jgi:DNA-binding LytR/AlgR family response regulator
VTFAKVLIVDDEQHARDDLAFLLESAGVTEKVEVAASASEALIMLQEAPADIVFLDIRMPGLDGFQLARTLGQFSHPPAVVFVSAHEQHAVEAFAIDATDYLLKPVSMERLTATLRRIESRVVDKTASDTPPLGSERNEDDALPFVAVEVAGKIRLIDRGEIRYAETEGDYVRFHTYKDAYLVRRSLTSLAEQWSSEGFVRVHRSFLVNLRHVIEIQPYFNQKLIVRLNDLGETKIPVSRRRAGQLRERLGLGTTSR